MHSSSHWAGIDIGGTNVKAVLINIDGDLVAQDQFLTEDSASAVWAPSIRDRLADWQREFGEPEGIGIASPGLVTSAHRSVSWMQGRMEAVCGFDWTIYLESKETVPVVNDAKAALLAEAWIGAARSAQNAFLLTLGTGVGGAAIVDGRLLDGALGRAGHLGHISLDPLGDRDIVGTPGSLEDKVGNATLEKRTQGRYRDMEQLVNALKLGDADAAGIWDGIVRDLAAGIVSLINVLDPEVVILGGGITRAGQLLFEPLMKAVDQIEWRPFGNRLPIVPARLGEYAGAIGAARFAMTYPKEIH